MIVGTADLGVPELQESREQPNTDGIMLGNSFIPLFTDFLLTSLSNRMVLVRGWGEGWI